MWAIINPQAWVFLCGVCAELLFVRGTVERMSKYTHVHRPINFRYFFFCRLKLSIINYPEVVFSRSEAELSNEDENITKHTFLPFAVIGTISRLTERIKRERLFNDFLFG